MLLSIPGRLCDVTAEVLNIEHSFESGDSRLDRFEYEIGVLQAVIKICLFF